MKKEKRNNKLEYYVILGNEGAIRLMPINKWLVFWSKKKNFKIIRNHAEKGSRIIISGMKWFITVNHRN